ncbi:MAG: GGDEF domain-containing protein [Coriobacteriales bacterium]|nr:GGDEF domain-containing protein [Coriobacteriales bacterium]
MNIFRTTKLPRQLPVLLLSLGAFLLCVIYFASNPHLVGGAHEARVAYEIEFSQGWTTTDGDVVDLRSLDDIPGFAEHGATILNTLPSEIDPDAEFSFLSKNVVLQVYYNAELAYSYTPESSAEGAFYTAHFNFAPLSTINSESRVTIKLKPVYPEGGSRLSNMYVSGTIKYIHRYVREHGIAFIMSLTVCFIGLAVLVLNFAMRESTELDLLALGGLCILMGIWSGAETLIPQLVVGLDSLIAALDYMALLFVPYPIIQFTSSLLRPKRRELFNRIAFIALILSVASTVLLSVAFNMDMHQLLIITHIQLVLCALLLLCEIMSSFSERGHSLVRGMREANRSILIAFLFFTACALVDFIVFNLNKRGVSDSAFFMRIGLFVLAVTLAINAFRASISFLRRAEQAEAVEAVAYLDALTNLGNRTAWHVMRDEMSDALNDGLVDDVMVCQFDVNFLKKVNDSLGHAAGDRYLKLVADSINRSFGTEGACYRTGGDEFTVIIVGINLNERLEMCSQLLEESLNEQDEMCEDEFTMKTSIAKGFAKVSETKAHTIRSAKELADKRMYAEKRAMKCERTD